MQQPENNEFFIVGSTYRNRKSSYEVLQIEPKEIMVRLDDGKEVRLNKNIAARIAQNITLEEVSTIPPGIRSSETPDFFWTLGAIAIKGDLQAEIPPQSWYGFWADYTRITGIPASNSSPGISRITIGGQNKWGCELRIYIPVSFYQMSRFRLPADVHSASGNNPNNLRINSNWFWWHLIRTFNYRSGNKQDIMQIEATVPKAFVQDFRLGYKI